MNKIFNNLKIILLCINLIGIIYLFFIIKNNTILGSENLKLFIYVILLFILIFITFKDLKNKVQNSFKYNTLFCLVEIIILFLIFRMFFDNNLNFYINLNLSDDFYINGYLYHILYFLQNFYYIVILYIGLIIYHKIECHNVKYKESKFSISSIIYLIINFILVIPTLNCLNYSPITLLIFITLELVMITLEIFSLIKNNHKKYDFPIYISFIFNLFAVIFIIISIIL